MKFSNPAVRHSLGAGHCIFAIVLLIRLIVLARLTASPFLLPARGDMHFYDEWARRILQGHFTDHLAFYGLPLYAYLLAFIYKLVGYGPFVPGLLQAFLEAGTGTIIYKLGTRVFSPTTTPEGPADVDPLGFTVTKTGKFIGVAAALGWAFFAPAQAYAVILMPTVWFVFAFWFMIWLIVRSKMAPNHLACFGYGLLVGFVAMGVATVLFLLPLLFAAIFLKATPTPAGRPFGARILAAVLIFAGIGVGASPCWIHNYFVARDPVLLSAHSGVNYWIGNNSLANGYPRFPPGLHAGQQTMLADSITAAEKATGHSLSRSDVSAYWSAKTRDYIRNHPVDWVKLLGTKAKNFWNAFQYDDLSIITNLREEGVILPGLYFGLIAALAIPGMLLAWRIAPKSRWIIAAVLLSMLSLLPVFITERYRLVAGPGLMLLAAFGLSTFWKACATGQLRVATTYLTLLVASTIFVAWPQRDPSLWALDAYNSGWQALESNDFVTAERKLNLAYGYVPTNAETNFALGNLRMAQKKAEAARSFYRNVLEIEPRHKGALNNLGLISLETSRFYEAEQFFEAALAQAPRDPKTHYLLAKTLLAKGDRDSARTEIATAITLKPDQPEFKELQEQIETGSR